MSTITPPVIKIGFSRADYSGIQQHKPELLVQYDGGKGKGTPIGEDNIFTNVNKAKVQSITHGINNTMSTAILSFPELDFGDHIHFATPIKIISNSGYGVIFKGILVKETARLQDHSFIVEAYGPRFILNKDSIAGKFYSNDGTTFPDPDELKIPSNSNINYSRKRFWISETGCHNGDSSNTKCGYFLTEPTVFNPLDENDNPVKNCYKKAKGGQDAGDYNVAFAIPDYSLGDIEDESYWTYGDVLRYINQYYIDANFSNFIIDKNAYLILDRLGEPKELNLDCRKVANAIGALFDNIGSNVVYKFEVENNKHVFRIVIPKGLEDRNGTEFESDLVQRTKKLAIGPVGEVRDNKKTGYYSKVKAKDEIDINVNDITVTRDIISTVTQFVGISDPLYLEITFKLIPMWAATEETKITGDIGKWIIQQGKLLKTKLGFGNTAISGDNVIKQVAGRYYKLPNNINYYKAGMDRDDILTQFVNEYVFEAVDEIHKGIFVRSRNRKLKPPETPEIYKNPGDNNEKLKYRNLFLIKHDRSINNDLGNNDKEFSIISNKGNKEDSERFTYNAEKGYIVFENPQRNSEFANSDLEDLNVARFVQTGNIFCDIYATALVPFDIPSFINKYKATLKDCIIPFNILNVERKRGHKIIIRNNSILKQDKTNPNCLLPTVNLVNVAEYEVSPIEKYKYLNIKTGIEKQQSHYMNMVGALVDSNLITLLDYISQKFQTYNKIRTDITANMSKLNTSYHLGDHITEIKWSGTGNSNRYGYKNLKTSITGITHNGSGGNFTTDFHITDLFIGV